MSMQRSCWIVETNSKKIVQVEPITAKFCKDELQQCQDSHKEVKVQITSHRKIKPVTLEYQTLRAMPDQMNTNSPIRRHIVATPE